MLFRSDLVALKGQCNLELWEHAARNGFTLVSKDNPEEALLVLALPVENAV